MSLIPLGIRGVNVTTPYKEMVLQFLDEISKAAAVVGCVNTILVKNNRLLGYNTDIYGFKKSLIKYKLKIKGKNILLIGAGGAGRACSWVMGSAGPRNFLIADRLNQRARKVAKLFNGKVLRLDKINDAIPNMDLVVNATPIDLQHIIIPIVKKGSTYYDINYKFKRIQTRRVRVINGLSMLVLQGARSFTLWTGKKPPIEVMEKAAGLKNG